MPIEIPASMVGRFASTDQARAYVHAQSIKKQIVTLGQEIAHLDNTPVDLNIDRGTVVAANASLPNRGYVGDAVATFKVPEQATPPSESPKKTLSQRLMFWKKGSKAPDLPPENITSVFFSAWKQGNEFQIKLGMSPIENGRRYEYKNFMQTMTFNEDRCGNLVIEQMNGF